MKLRKLRWYERIQEAFSLKPQWFVLLPDGTLEKNGYITPTMAKAYARMAGASFIVWIPSKESGGVEMRTIAK